MKFLAAVSVALLIGAAAPCVHADQNIEEPTDQSAMDTGQANPRALPADIRVIGHLRTILNGDVTPEARDGTRQVSALADPVTTEVFGIRNIGESPLVLIGSSPVSIIGSSLISIESQPKSMTLQPFEETTFTVRFSPVELGEISATVRISSSDPDSPVYTYAVMAKVVIPGAPIELRFDGVIPIPDNNPAGLSIPFTLSGVPAPVAFVNVRFNGSDCSTNAGAGVEHPFIGDLVMVLKSPDSTTISLMRRPGQGNGNGSRDNFCNLLLDDDPDNPTTRFVRFVVGQNAFSGTYRPDEPLSTFTGTNPNGDWILNIADVAPADLGVVRSVSLIFRMDVSMTEAQGWELYE